MTDQFVCADPKMKCCAPKTAIVSNATTSDSSEKPNITSIPTYPQHSRPVNPNIPNIPNGNVNPLGPNPLPVFQNQNFPTNNLPLVLNQNLNQNLPQNIPQIPQNIPQQQIIQPDN